MEGCCEPCSAMEVGTFLTTQENTEVHFYLNLIVRDFLGNQPRNRPSSTLNLYSVHDIFVSVFNFELPFTLLLL